MTSFVFHLPAFVVTVPGDSVAFKYTLQISDQSENVASEDMNVSHFFLRNTIHTDRSQSAPKSEGIR
jgi:hypothetical protein